MLAIFPVGGRSIWASPKQHVTSVPLPISEEIFNHPPVCSALCFNSGRPIPTFLVLRDVVNGSVTCLRVLAEIPFPSSTILRRYLSSLRSSVIEIFIFWRLPNGIMNDIQNVKRNFGHFTNLPCCFNNASLIS